jgi:hypothetical protein
MKLFNKEIKLDTFILIDKINDLSIINNLKEDIYKNDEYFHQHTNVIAKHTKFDFLIGNKNFHDFLKSIKKQINLIFKENFVVNEVWANIYNGDDYAKIHHHEGSTAFSGILYLTDGPGPGTYFQEYDMTIEEEAGKFVLFHGHLKHEVKKFKYTKDRLTIAFNFTKVSFFNKDQTVEWINA